jgi:hypothetical protein
MRGSELKKNASDDIYIFALPMYLLYGIQQGLFDISLECKSKTGVEPQD